MRIPTNNPYCAFKDDRMRLLALVARDIRNALTAYACLQLSGDTIWLAVARWLGVG
jgi:hypothetical protein